MLKKRFGGIRMTWPKVIVFAVIAGVFTALMAMLVPEENSFHNIAVYPEAWVLFAIIIILGCEQPLEAACKTFVFFLISQPLVYLIQVPFNAMGWSLFGYYRYWFFVTILTFPGAFLGWYIKKDNIWSALILSVMLVLLIFLGVGFLRTAIVRFPHHLLSALFCFGQAAALIFVVLHSKKARWTAIAVSLAALAIFLAITFAQKPERLSGNILLDEAAYPLDETWSVSVGDESISTGEIRQGYTGDYQLIMHFYKTGDNTVTLSDSDGNEHRLIISIDEENNLRVREP